MLDLTTQARRCAINETQIVKTIKAHLAKSESYQDKADKNQGKADEHLITAGQWLMTLKGNSPDQATFLQIVKEEIGLGKSRAYELIQIADGTKTVESLRAEKAESMRRVRDEACPQRGGQTADADIPPFLDRTQPSDDDGPTLYIQTSGDCPRRRVITYDDQPDTEEDDKDDFDGPTSVPGQLPDDMRQKGFLYRAREAIDNARADDLTGIRITDEMRSAAEDAAAAWNAMAYKLRGDQNA